MRTPNEIIQFLAHYNSWRRGDETIEQPPPDEIGAAIDDAVNLLRRHDQLERKNAALRAALERIMIEGDSCQIHAIARAALGKEAKP